MCTSIVEIVGADGAGKGGDGWFDLTHSVVSYDHPHHALLEEALSERAGHKVEIFTPQRGSKRAFLDLVENNAAHSFEQRFRVLKPTSKAIGEAVQAALNLPEEPQRIESFDI